jgi:hypothetical protein
MEDNLPNLNAEELSAYASAKHLAGVPGDEIEQSIAQMLRNDGWKEAAITPMINEIARRVKSVAGKKGSPRSSPKTPQNATAEIMAQLVQLLTPITARLEALEQQGSQSTPQSSESQLGLGTPLTEHTTRTKYPHPELFDGDRSKYSAFRYKTKAKLYNDYQGTPDRMKIAYVVSRCSERASDVILPWAEQHQEYGSIEDLWSFLNQQYDDPHLKAKALDQLSNLRQGKRSIRDYHMEFNRLELQAEVRISDAQKKSMFSKGLSVEVQKALILAREDLSFEEFAREATRVSDNLYRVNMATRSRKEFSAHHNHNSYRQVDRNSTRTPSPPENMDWEPTKVSKASTRDRKLNSDQIECYSCGKKGHIARHCGKGVKPRNTKVSRAAQREPSPTCRCHAETEDSSNSEDSEKE